MNSETSEYLGLLRKAIKRQRKVKYDYQREDGERSSRIVHPLGLFYWGKVWTLVAWCELRNDFRHFRLDRMQNALQLEESFESTPGRTLSDFLATVCDER